jgi:hypothetical protein
MVAFCFSLRPCSEITDYVYGLSAPIQSTLDSSAIEPIFSVHSENCPVRDGIRARNGMLSVYEVLPRLRNLPMDFMERSLRARTWVGPRCKPGETSLVAQHDLC